MGKGELVEDGETAPGVFDSLERSRSCGYHTSRFAASFVC